jgi:hypothetical protein
MAGGIAAGATALRMGMGGSASMVASPGTAVKVSTAGSAGMAGSVGMAVVAGMAVAAGTAKEPSGGAPRFALAHSD